MQANFKKQESKTIILQNIINIFAINEKILVMLMKSLKLFIENEA